MSQPPPQTRETSRASSPVIDFLRQAEAHRLSHGHGKALLDHLVGTSVILRRWLQPRWLQDAGALHSIYSTDVYQQQLVPLSQRDAVQRVAGERAERLAYLFCVLSRRHFFQALSSREGVSEQRMAVHRHASALGDLESLTSDEVSQLLLLYMANEAEQAQTPSGEPADWLAWVSWMGSKLSPSAVSLPPPFDACTVTASRDEEAQAHQAYGAAVEASTDVPEMARHLSTAAGCCPWVAEPKILSAYLALVGGEPAKARYWLRDAKRTLADLGTAWDKRLSYDEWFALVSQLETIAYTDLDAAADLPTPELRAPRQMLHALTEQPGAPLRPGGVSLPALEGLPRRFTRYIEAFGESQRDSRMRIYPELRSQPWYDAAGFDLAHALESNYASIRREFLGIDPSAFHPESEDIGRTGSWDVFLLFERGIKKRDNCALFPITTQIIESHTTVRTLAGLIYFSRMQRGTHIAAHRGPTNMRLRLHLGIQVPRGDCGIRVGGETRGWQEGKCLVFDDHFEHEAWNATAKDRVVLIIDLWHTDLSPTEVRLLEGLQQYAFANARDLNQYWSRNAQAGHHSG